MAKRWLLARNSLPVLAAGLLLAFPSLTGVALAGGSAGTGPAGSIPASKLTCGNDASPATGGGQGANGAGPYDSTCPGGPSGNDAGDGQAIGEPCAGCVGNADNENPQGQLPGGSDHNRGYECDANKGVGQSNPAHTSCAASTPDPGPVSDPGSSGGGGDLGNSSGNPGNGGGGTTGGTTAGGGSSQTLTPVGITAPDVANVLGAAFDRSATVTAALPIVEPEAAVAAVALTGSLPRTGFDAQRLFLVAVALMAAGSLLQIRRRQQPGMPVRATVGGGPAEARTGD